MQIAFNTWLLIIDQVLVNLAMWSSQFRVFVQIKRHILEPATHRRSTHVVSVIWCTEEVRWPQVLQHWESRKDAVGWVFIIQPFWHIVVRILSSPIQMYLYSTFKTAQMLHRINKRLKHKYN